MTFQIRAIHLYSERGDVRTVKFRLGALNIITGSSATGKSSVLDIIDYCLASRNCSIPTGMIREYVSVFALELATQQGVVIAARRPPTEGKRSTSTMYVGFYDESASSPPRLQELDPNTDINGARAFLSSVTGIVDNLTDSGEGTRERFAATIRHALYFNFQAQEEIANPEILFHSQGDQFVPQAIRDVLPYFLGLVDPQYVIKQGELRAAERRLRVLQRTQADSPIDDEVGPRVAGLIREAQSVNLLPSNATASNAQQAVELLSATAQVDVDISEDPLDDDTRQLEQLFSTRVDLRESLTIVRAENANLRSLLSAHVGYDSEAREQHARLQSVELLRIESEAEESHLSECPVCGSQLDEAVPTVTAVIKQLRAVERDIEQVRQNVPGIQQVIADNEQRAREVNELLLSNQREIDTLTATRERLRRVRDQAVQRALVRGRISLYLESVPTTVEVSALVEEINSLIATIDVLRFEIDIEQVQDRLASAVSRISTTLHQLSQQLGLEHSESPVRLDPKKLTVVFDTPNGPRELNQIGSGENWLGCHVSTFVALHRYFMERERPVPRLVVFDQPSQVYFPPDRRSDDSELEDEDRTALANMLGLVRDLANESSGRFQAIIMDHADLDADWFQEAVVERWRDGEKLVPTSWIQDGR